MAVPPAMGSAQAINFQPTGGGKAAVTGDFVLTAKEVGPVMQALRDHCIEVTALHNHMLGAKSRACSSCISGATTTRPSWRPGSRRRCRTWRSRAAEMAARSDSRQIAAMEPAPGPVSAGNRNVAEMQGFARSGAGRSAGSIGSKNTSLVFCGGTFGTGGSFMRSTVGRTFMPDISRTVLRSTVLVAGLISVATFVTSCAPPPPPPPPPQPIMAPAPPPPPPMRMERYPGRVPGGERG
jgi:hypothetical protein